jgi:hypothetical protein
MLTKLKQFTQTNDQRKRILTLDILRGLFMICIVVDHTIGWSPSPIAVFTGQGLLFASAAEGFFAISGILVGYVYRNKIISTTKWVFQKLWKRALLLYGITVGMSIVFYLWTLVMPTAAFGLTPWQGSFGSFLVSTFTLSSVYGWHDFLAKYAIFMVIAPFAVWLCAKGKAYIVLALSTLTWLLFHENHFLQAASSWQIIFMFSIVIGFYLNQVETFALHMNKKLKNTPYVSLVTIALGVYLISLAAFTIAPPIYGHLVGHLSDPFLQSIANVTNIRDTLFFPRDNISIYRLAVGMLWFVALYAFFRKHEIHIERITHGLLSLIGKNSLLMFVVHGILLFLLYGFIGTQESSYNIFINTFVHMLMISTVVLIAYTASQLKMLMFVKEQVVEKEAES